LDLRQPGDARRPWQRRAAPDLAPGRQLRTLAQAADAQRVELRRAFGDGCVDRRAAVRAEGVRALRAALGGLDVDLRLPGQLEGRRGRRNRSAIRRAGERLAV